jgi:hypothetical protein
MEKKKKKLELKRQAIRELAPSELRDAQGGIVVVTTITTTTVFIPTPAH